EHPQLLAAVAEYAGQQKEALIQATATQLLKTLVESVIEKLDTALDVVHGKDEEYNQQMAQLTSEMNNFHLEVRTHELALKKRIRDASSTLLTALPQQFSEIRAGLHAEVKSATLDDLSQPDWLRKRLRVQLENRLPPLTQAFTKTLGEAVKEMEERIKPSVERTLAQIQGLEQSFEFSSMVAAGGVASVGIFVAATIFPWVMGAAGVAAVASFIPGVGALIGAAAVTVGKDLAVMLVTSGKESYGWLKGWVGDWKAGQEKAAYLTQLDATLFKMEQEVTSRIKASIEPDKILNSVINGQFPQQQVLLQRQQQAAKLDRTMLRQQRSALESLRGEFSQQLQTIIADPTGGHHG
ncbi:MAG: hypothetical protein HQL49_11820, partial [Gammaproteobacteria bacterium]|nr:hypothetical protein [Gammaproteobacteria bacterium]